MAKQKIDWTKYGALANIGCFVIAIPTLFVGAIALHISWRNQLPPTAATATTNSTNPTTIMWIFLVGVVLAGVLHLIAAILGRRRQINPPHPHEDIKVYRTVARLDQTPGRKYPLKVYVELINSGNSCGEVAVSHWIPGKGIRAKVEPNVLQLWLGNSGWLPEGDGVDRVAVAPGQRCQLWIAPHPDYSQADLEQRCNAKRLGKLVIRVDGNDRELIL
jgi:hypothetical protein